MQEASAEQRAIAEEMRRTTDEYRRLRGE
jgi:hypothetical protein